MKEFAKILAIWYQKNGRDLPWRSQKEPYPIWLSEIILQQTRVEQGTPYWHRFMAEFPDIQSLAAASEGQIMRLWQGLGYYSRARNLHLAAKQVVQNHNGKFPENFNEIKNLKGIGDYTAAAIASFSFNLPYAVVDGNVYRFLSRYFGIDTPIDSTNGKKEFAKIAQSLLDKKNPGLHNQAMMEMGATICKAANPLCIECPFAFNCIALKNDLITTLPIKSKKTKVSKRYFHYLIFHTEKKVIIKKRVNKDIWQGLYDFPLIESNKQLSANEILNNPLLEELQIKNFHLIRKSSPIKHLLSHQTIFAEFYWIGITKIPPSKAINNYTISLFSELDNYAMPQLIVKYLNEQA